MFHSRRGDDAGGICRCVDVEAIQRLPGFQPPAERQLETGTDLPGVLEPQGAGARLAKSLRIELTGACGRGRVPAS
jgi:hypothetical protein